MCLGVPGRIIELRNAAGELASALVEFDGLRRSVCVELVPEALPGDYVVVHAGIALSCVDAGEAQRLLMHLRELGEPEPEPEP
jgi:hydrogenase expression/formation protein HypC